MRIPFRKYQATGNDFILIDNREGNYSLTDEQIRQFCDRRLGIGADGLLLIEKHATLDFNLVYYNSDGSQSLCGNGCRAAVSMASRLGLVNGKASFHAYDGVHSAELQDGGIIKLKMNDVSGVRKEGQDFIVYTGSPHYIRFVDEVTKFPVVEEGRKIRYSSPFKAEGINVNFVERLDDNSIFVRTYERGVEDETLSCGTGVTAAAIAASFHGYTSPVTVETPGGTLKVAFTPDSDRQAGTFHDVFLIGPAKMVFEGQMEL